MVKEDERGVKEKNKKNKPKGKGAKKIFRIKGDFAGPTITNRRG